MAEKNTKAIGLLQDADEYLVLVPEGDDFKYVWVVADEDRKAKFQEALARFAEV